MGNKTDEIKLYTPYVDATGHVVGKNIETVILPYGYKYFKTDGIVSEDEKGDLYSTNINTNGIKETKPSKAESDTQAHNTQDTLSINPANKWIQTKLVDTENDGDVLTIAHEIHSIDERNSYLGDNETSHSNLNNVEAVGGDEVNLTMYDWTYDNAGHITSKREHTYTLPYGYKTITTNGRRNFEDINTEAFDSNKNAAEKRSKIVADTTQDSLALNSGNKWIRIDTDANNDEVVFSHDVHEITHDITEEATDDLNNNKNNTIQNKINIPDWTFDNAGHITHKSDRIYTLPFGYKHIIVNNNGDGVIAEPGSMTGTQTADNTQGALTLDSSNKWIVLDKTNSNDVIKFGHLHSELPSGIHALGAQEPKFGKTFEI
jgi:hypothetical protein